MGLRHLTAATLPDDPSKEVSSGEWNEDHKFTEANIGALLVRGASSDLVAGVSSVAIGQVLISQGVGSLPAWTPDPALNSLAVTLAVDAQAFRSTPGGAFHWNGRSVLRSPADTHINLLTLAETVGVGLDIGTDAVLKVRTRAQTGYATVDCLGLKASGVAGVNFGPAHPASITIVNGIVTACS